MKSKKIIASLLIIVIMIGLMPTKIFAETAFKLTITPNKTEAHPGDEITYTVKMSAVQNLAGMKFKLDIPEGLTFIEGKEVDGLQATLKAAKAEFTTETKVFVVGSSNYSSSSDTTLMTFKCSVDAEINGEKEITFIIDEDDIFDTSDENIAVNYSDTGSTVNVTIPATGIELDKDSISLEKGSSQKLTATISPENSTDSITWESNDETKASVDQNGNVTAVSEGQATITVKTTSGKSATCTVTVIKPICKHLNKSTVQAKDPTCTVTGNIEYKVCDDCGQLFKTDGTTETTIEEVTKAALGHDYTIPKYDENQHWNECSRCHTADTKINHAGEGEYQKDNDKHWKICGCGVKVNEESHIPGNKVNENIKEATCTETGSHDEVIYCSVCNYEISRTPKVDEAKGHTDGEPVKENVKPATCTEAGSYDEVVYCTVCHEKVSTTPGIETPKGHNEGEPVKENIVPSTHLKTGSYDEVTYCTECHEELKRENKTSELIPHDGSTSPWYGDEDGHWRVCGCGTIVDTGSHIEGTAVSEKIVPATCTEEGSHDEVVYCSVCNYELSRTPKVDEAKGHTEGNAVKENIEPATCTEEGSHDEVVYCSVCLEELSRTPKVDAAKGHTEGSPVIENEIESTVDKEGSYDEVIYCTECKEELSRTSKVTPKFVYEVLDGEGSTYVDNTDGTITIRVNGKFEKFEGIKIDDKNVDKENYTAKSGSTIVTLKAAYLNTLSVGTHKIAFIYDDGEVETTFNVAENKANNTQEKNNKNNPSTPKTDDTSNMPLWIVGLAISGILFVIILKCKAKGTRRRSRH